MIELNIWFQNHIIKIALNKHTKQKLHERVRVSNGFVEHTTCTYTLRKGIPHLHIIHREVGGEDQFNWDIYCSALKADWNVQNIIEEGPITLWRGPGRK